MGSREASPFSRGRRLVLGSRRSTTGTALPFVYSSIASSVPYTIVRARRPLLFWLFGYFVLVFFCKMVLALYIIRRHLYIIILGSHCSAQITQSSHHALGIGRRRKGKPSGLPRLECTRSPCYIPRSSCVDQWLLCLPSQPHCIANYERI